MFRALLIWLLLMAVETVHGILRGALLTPRVGDFRARQIGVFVGSVLILAIARFTIRWTRLSGTGALLRAGAMWAMLTLAFEVTLGRALRLSWQRIFSDYDLENGGLMPFGMLVLLLAPLLAFRWSSRSRSL
jgi:hypothetical protein